jgi:hypothetical protein
MNTKSLLNLIEKEYNREISTIINKYIKIKDKHCRNEQDIAFISTCLNNEVLPNFSGLKIDKKYDNNFINNIRHSITKKELATKKQSKRQFEKDIKQHEQMLFDVMGGNLWQEVIKVIRSNESKTIYETKSRHNKKLEALGLQINMNVNSSNINNERNSINIIESISNRQNIFNLSNRTLTEVEERVLNKGLKFGIKNKKVDTFEILTRFEILAQSLMRHDQQPNISNEPNNNKDRSDFFNELGKMAYEFIELSKRARDTLTEDESKALYNLSKDQTIIITKADKGNAVVIQNKKDYIKKVKTLLTKDGKFEKIKQDPTIDREKALAQYLRNLTKPKLDHSNKIIEKAQLSEEDFKRICPSGSRAGVMYGLPKIHKDNCPIRPVVSACGTYNYFLAK